MKYLIFSSLLLLVACDRVDISLPETKRLQERVQVLENRVSVFEAQVSQLGTKKETPANWILWKRQWTKGAVYAGPINFRALTAYESKDTCLKAAKSVAPLGATQISFEPPRFEWLDQSAEFSCLPMGVQP